MRSWAKAVWCVTPEYQSSLMERCFQGVGAGSQRGRDALRLTRVLTEYLHPWGEHTMHCGQAL